MDRLPGHETATRPSPVTETDGCKILRFPPRRPRWSMIDYGSGWYHQAAVDEAVRPTGPKR